MLKKIKAIFRKKKIPDQKPDSELTQNEADKIQALFKRMHRHYQDGSFERAKETQVELKKLVSAIQSKDQKALEARSIRAKNESNEQQKTDHLLA